MWSLNLQTYKNLVMEMAKKKRVTIKTVGRMKIPHVNKEMKTIVHIKKKKKGQFAMGSPKTGI